MSIEFPQNPTEFCITDVGSTTTKAIFFKKDSDWQFFREETPTTVEKPHVDVTVGVIGAFGALEKTSGKSLLKEAVLGVPYLSTSSAGGGLAMVVTGLVQKVTAKSAERVAFGAGAVVLDVIALDDGRTPYKKVEALKRLRPDMVLLAGGFDGEAISGPVFLTELINQSDLHPKSSQEAKLAVIYAGNENARKYVEATLGGRFLFYPVHNIRPASNRENLEPARKAIHELFMEHVMSHAPGYEKLKSWVSTSILPTPAAVNKLLALISEDLKARILAIDIGGATTDVYTAENGRVFRTVSANLGMSYSILNVIKLAGLNAVKELLDFEVTEEELLNRIGNKYLKPTKLPENIEDVKVEAAVASVAIREAVKEHFRVMQEVSLSLGEEELSMSVLVRRRKGKSKEEKFLLPDYDIIIGSGGILSHSPRQTAAMILVNGLQPQGIVTLAVDSLFMFPHLGVLSQVNPELACELFYRFGLIKVAKLLAPRGKAKPGAPVLKIEATTNRRRVIDEILRFGEVKFIPLGRGEDAKVRIKSSKLKLKERDISVDSDTGGLVIDVRGRPVTAKASAFVQPGHKLPVRRIELDQEEGIYQGEIRIKRELAIPGELFVKPGDSVSPDTVVAKSTKTFLRPFFLHVAEAIDVPPEELPDYFHKKVGEEVSLDEILAEKKARLASRLTYRKIYRSPVSGWVERILPTGTVIVREKTEHAKGVCVVNVAKELGVESQKIKPYLKCEVGQEVEKGQWLAVIDYYKVCKSPTRGKVEEINFEYGLVTIEPLLEELELIAWLPGKVEEVTDKGCVISNQGVIIEGVWGRGGEVFGKLTFDEAESGHIVVKEAVTRDFLSLLKSRNVAGLITGGLSLKDVFDVDPVFTIVVTERFGAEAMRAEIREILNNHKGGSTLIDGTTQLRVGVKRPRIILPFSTE